MASIQYYMDYVIFFQDPAEYLIATAIAGGNLLKLAPRDAATLFGIPFPYPSGDMSTIPRGIYFIFPYTVGAELLFPGSSGIFIDDTILTKTVPGQAGVPASIWPAGPDGVFTWSGNITGNKGASTSTEPAPSTISQRRWIHGQELSESNEGGSNQTLSALRDCSRTIDGIGWLIRGTNITGPWTHTINEFRPGLNPRTTWERFYIRARRNPVTNNIRFWRCRGNLAAAAGAGLYYQTDGTIHSYNINSISQIFDKGLVLTPVINQWYRIDIHFKYGSGLGPPAGIVNTYINGVLALSWSDQTQGMAENSIHTSSELGRGDGTTDNEIEMDFDDWICADLPGNLNASTLVFNDANFPIDWLVGSHVRSHFAISATQVNWLPAAGALQVNQVYSPDVRPAGTTEVTSTTALAQLITTTDALTRAVMDTIANTIGIVASVLSIWSKNAAATDGKLGMNGVLTTIDQGAAEVANKVAVFPSGQLLPAELSPMTVTHEKSNDANLDTTYMIASIHEYIGVWGPEDDPAFNFPITRLSYLHNCRYANTVWGYVGSQPAAPQFSKGFTYVGNGSYQEFTLPGPCHLLYIRPVTDATAGIWFQGASLGAHLGTTDELVPGVRMWFDSVNGVFKFSVTGIATTGVNITGKTYQVIAFCDPGMRFCIASAFSHGANSIFLPKANPLVTPDFLADVGFFQFDFVGSSSAGNGLFVKGPNDVGNTARNLQSSSTPAGAVANFTAGNINSFDNLHLASTGPCNFLLFRKADSGPDGCSSNVVIQTATYTGNGAGGNRVISITPASGRFPLLVLVWPATGATAGFRRDPSHAGVNSSNINNNVNDTLAITATGIDSITVGTTLNANAILYSIFIICGDTAGQNNGSFVSTYCAGDGPYIAPTAPNNEPNIIGNGGLILGGAVPFTIIKDASGIYTLVPGKTHDSLIDRNTVPSGKIDVKIPDPTWKTGYLGG